MANQQKLRVLSIAHPAVKTSIGRLRYRELTRATDLDVHLVVPDRWRENDKIYEPDPGGDAGYTLHIEKAALTYLPKVQWYAHFYPRLRSLVDKLAPDVIHLWEEPWSLVAFQASRLARDAALVLEVDQNILRRLPFPFEAIRRRVLQRTDFILSRSRDATSVVRNCGYVGPVSSIAYGVDQTVFTPKPGADVDPSRSPLLIGYCGRLVVEKGLDDVLDAMKIANVPVKLSIMGDGAYAGSLRSRVQSEGLSNRVDFLPWKSPHGVAEFFQAQHASILMSRTARTWREQFGRTIIESQSSGTPVIGSTSGSIPDVIGNGGWVVAEQNPVELAALLGRLSADGGEIVARRAAGLANVSTRYTYDIVAQDLADGWRAAALAIDRRKSISPPRIAVRAVR